MSLLSAIPAGMVVGLDTGPLVYWIEQHADYHPILQPFFQTRLNAGLNEAVTSVVSLSEVLVKPFTLLRSDLVTQYRDFLLRSSHFSVQEITIAIAERAAELRARYGVRLPDAFQIAAALDQKATFFITNDLGLKRVTELTVLVLKDFLAPPAP
ncbi:MAG: PIN domain-containing protein [Gemmataceae bacterium]|nr:PIN domain-containing protein [Gemmataceae bacterium]